MKAPLQLLMFVILLTQVAAFWALWRRRGRLEKEIAQRRQMEGALRESEQRFRVMADTAPVLVWTSGRDGRCDYVNRPWLEFTGRRLEAELDDGWIDCVHPDDRPDAVQSYRVAFRAREPFRMEYRLRRHDGMYRWVLGVGAPRYTADGAFAGYVGSAVDVTEHRTAQRALSNLSQKLLEAQEHERSRIARELHDDIGQRVALLTIDLDRLLQELPAGSHGVRAHVRELGARATDLQRDVQAMSHRLHSSKLELLGLGLAVASFCRELSEQHQVVIDFSRHDIPEQLPAALSLTLFRVVQEALTNAVKHAGVRQFSVSLLGTSESILLTVADAGAGFDPESAMSGRGLGLISMHERLSLIGGELDIDSIPGSGTRVRARVPWRRSAKQDLDRSIEGDRTPRRLARGG